MSCTHHSVCLINNPWSNRSRRADSLPRLAARKAAQSLTQPLPFSHLLCWAALILCASSGADECIANAAAAKLPILEHSPTSQILGQC